jgi:glycine cleavage system transcriptional repressor
MIKNLVLTLTGHDRIGLVEMVTKLVLDHGGNVDASKMARLGGEFAILMLVSVPSPRFDELNEGINGLQSEGFKVTTCETKHEDPDRFTGWIPYQVQVKGADHEGIIHQITRSLVEYGANVETMDTNMVKAPMSGTPLFMMTAVVLVPPALTYGKLQDEMEAIGDDMNVDIDVLPYSG